MVVVGRYSSGEKRGHILFYPQYMDINCCFPFPFPLPLPLPCRVLACLISSQSVRRRACMHGVMIKAHSMRPPAGAYGSGRLLPHAHARAIWVYVCKGGMVSEDHVMLLLLLGLLLLAALGALRAL
jgi:hypothetical protein